MRILMLVGVLLLAQACVLVPVRRHPGPPPPPPSSPRPMNYDEAVGLGLQFCRSRGYDCKLKEAHKTGNDVWKVKFRAAASGAKGRVHLSYNAYSRELLRVDEKVKARRDDWEGDDDDDDDNYRGHGKKKGHAKRDD